MNLKNILFDIDGGIATIKINRPDKMNALNLQTIDELDLINKEIKKNDSIKAVLITGSGEKSFVAGADIKELNLLSAKKAFEISQKGQHVFADFENSSKPVLAAVNGYALGGGCELALACHFRFAADSASFGQPEVNLGLIPGYGGTQRLSRLIGKSAALELILTGEIISAARAFEIGLINRVFNQDELIIKSRDFLEKIISKGPQAVKFSIEAVSLGVNTKIENGLKIESEFFSKCFETEDMKEGTEAFLERRKPVFKGR
ncbi:MAG: enoyl-CoA hydratase/isomerase family protein [Calditrichaeota bacterium]|nr:enoyl-CoA hydratase/isomerase family protein [Calditrichota bacterium]